MLVAEGDPHYIMLNLKEIRALLEYAEKNMSETNDDRVVLVTQPNSVASAHYVANVDAFFAEERKVRDTFDAGLKPTVSQKNWRDYHEITDHDSW